jgi:hypothetical protein
MRLEHSAEVRWAKAIEVGRRGYIRDEQVLTQVETCIRKNVGVRSDLADPYPYGSLDVGAIIFNLPDQNKKPRPKNYLVLVNGFGSSYCMNKGDSHNSNKIYFVINKEGIHQRCHCTCKVDRKNGQCANFKSVPFELPHTVMSKLFEGTAANDDNAYMPGREEIDLDVDVAPRASIVNFNPQQILGRLPVELPMGCIPFESFLKRKREQEQRRYGLDDPEERLQKMLVVQAGDGHDDAT